MSAARLVIGSRGSALARAQAEMVCRALKSAYPDVSIEVRIIRTAGDERAGDPIEMVDKQAGRKGMFTAEIERALLAGEIDVAVHSAKDLPSESRQGAVVGAVLERGAVLDVLVSKQPGGMTALPRQAVIATGSVRRANQLNLVCNDFRIVDLRGNVPTRLRTLRESDWDAAILALAGLERLGLGAACNSFVFEDQIFFAELLSLKNFVPAGGQGTIALQIRGTDEATKKLVERVNHQESFLCLRAEREFLRLLQGDCDSPVGVLAAIENDEMELRAQVFEETGEPPRTGHIRRSLKMDAPEKIAAELFARLYGKK